MMKARKDLAIIMVISISLFLLMFFTFRGEEEVFTFKPNEVCYEVWGGFNGDAVGESYYDGVNGKVVMWINDTSGSWGLAKISRGLMPHSWGLRYAPLDNEMK